MSFLSFSIHSQYLSKCTSIRSATGSMDILKKVTRPKSQEADSLGLTRMDRSSHSGHLCKIHRAEQVNTKDSGCTKQQMLEMKPTGKRTRR